MKWREPVTVRALGLSAGQESGLCSSSLSLYRWPWRPKAALQLCGRSGLILGLPTSCPDYRINVQVFTCPRGKNRDQWPWVKNTNLHNPNIYYHSSFDILTPLHCFIFQNTHSVDGLYTHLCLWFDEVRVKTNLKFCLLIHYFPQKGKDFYAVDCLLG